mgnify:FL=1
MSKLAILYANEIEAGKITIENVPARLKSLVEAELDKRKAENGGK